MFIVKSEPCELRGIANKQKKDGGTYYLLNTEVDDGTPMQFYCPSANCLPQGLKKGEKIIISFEVKKYNGVERLVVTSVHKVG